MQTLDAFATKKWNHTDGDHRIEDIAAQDPVICDQMTRLALRFISAKGLSAEFADALDAFQSATQHAPVPETAEG
jgi:hypothetical protein